MGIFVVIAAGLLAVALIASQFPHWLTAAAFAANIAAYPAVWGGLPERLEGLGPQVIHIAVLIGGQLAAILGLLAPLALEGLRGAPRWARALGAGLVSLPGWLLLALLLY
jgi:hypothetical protein